MLQVRYSDRFVEELHLPVEKLDFGQAKPPLQAAEAGTSQAWPPVARPLLQLDPHHGLPHAVMCTSTPNSAQVQLVLQPLLCMAGTLACSLWCRAMSCLQTRAAAPGCSPGLSLSSPTLPSCIYTTGWCSSYFLSLWKHCLHILSYPNAAQRRLMKSAVTSPI